MELYERLKAFLRPSSSRSAYDSPVLVRTSHGLFHVQVVDLDREPSPEQFLPDIIGVAVAVFRVLQSIGTPKRPNARFEARVNALGYPRERRVTGDVFVAKSDAVTACQTYEQRMHAGWNPEGPSVAAP